MAISMANMAFFSMMNAAVAAAAAAASRSASRQSVKANVPASNTDGNANETKPHRKYMYSKKTNRKAKDANESINSLFLDNGVEGGNDVMVDDAYKLTEALEAYKRGDKDYVWAEEPNGGAASLKPGDTILFLFEWGWERGVVHSKSKCTKAQKALAKEFYIPVLIRYVIDGDYILQDFGEDSSYISRKDFERLRSGEEEVPSEVGLKSWCGIKLEHR